MYSIKDFLNIKSAGGPSFSASGDMLGYVSNLTGTFQAYYKPTKGGEPTQLTNFEDSISFAVFSPSDEDLIIFGRDEGGNEKTQLYSLRLSTKKITNLTNSPNAVHHWGGWSRDGKCIAFASTERNGTDFDVYTLNLETMEKTCVLADSGWYESLGFSPKGTMLLAIRAESNVNHDLFLIDLSNPSNYQHLTPHKGHATFGCARWLPDESGFYLISNQDTDLEDVRFYDVKAKSLRQVLAQKWEAEFLALTRDGELLAVHTNEDGYGKVCVYQTKNMQPIADQSFPKGLISSSTWSQDGRYLAFSLSSETKNTDVWVWERASDTYWQVTDSPLGVPESVFVEAELIRYQSFDGLEVPAYIYTPPHIDTSSAPAIIYIHGGPEMQARPGFSSLLQYFVYKGYVVVEPNVRGSTGYGKKYEQLDNVEKRLDSVHDLVGLRDYLVKNGKAHPDKICLMGGSYGGYMVLAGLAFWPDLWAAGVDTVGIANLVTFLENTSSYRRALREAEYGSLAQDREFLESVSPLNKVEAMKAPLFIIHGTNDPRVPLSEAQQMVEKLEALGRRVELLVYEDEGHGLAKLKNRLDAYPKVDDFLQTVLADV